MQEDLGPTDVIRLPKTGEVCCPVIYMMHYDSSAPWETMSVSLDEFSLGVRRYFLLLRTERQWHRLLGKVSQALSVPGSFLS